VIRPCGCCRKVSDARSGDLRSVHRIQRRRSVRRVDRIDRG
jgi:hypothetical protein